MFVSLFYRFRSNGLKVSLEEWLTLMNGLQQGLHDCSLHGFYTLCRAVVVSSETDFDRFDQVFFEFFRGIEPAHRLYLGLSTVSNGIPQSAPAVQGNGCTKNGIGHRRDNPKDLRKCWAHGSYVYSPQKEYAKAFAAYGFRRINGAVSAALQLAVSVGQQSGTF